MAGLCQWGDPLFLIVCVIKIEDIQKVVCSQKSDVFTQKMKMLKNHYRWYTNTCTALEF